MDKKQLFIETMQNTTNVALATCNGAKPNVRAISIGYNKEMPNTFYFSTFVQSAKANEIQANPNVSVIPFPDSADTEVSVRIHGIAAVADITLEQYADLIRERMPEFAAMLPGMADQCAIYQVSYTAAEVSLGMAPPEIVTF